MRTLAIALLLLSSCGVLIPSSNKKPEPPIPCGPPPAAVAAKPRFESHDFYFLEAHFALPSIREQVRITMNNEVMLDTCSDEKVEGFELSRYGGGVSIDFEMHSNEEWKNAYVAFDGQPMRTDLTYQIETRSTCNDSWINVVPPTQAAIEWRETGGGCVPPGYSGNFSGGVF